jgi:hypothetical protein
MPFDHCLGTLHKIVRNTQKDESNLEVEGLIVYLTMVVDAYLQRRQNVFTILGKDLTCRETVEEFDREYFLAQEDGSSSDEYSDA